MKNVQGDIIVIKTRQPATSILIKHGKTEAKQLNGSEAELPKFDDPQSVAEFFFKDEAYRQKFASMSLEGRESVEIDFQSLYSFDQNLALSLIEKPEETLKILENAAKNQLSVEEPEYASKLPYVKVQVVNLFEATPIRKIGAEDLYKLRMVKGLVVKATVVKPKILEAAFECLRCGTRQHIPQTEGKRVKPVKCSNPHCMRAGPFRFVPKESRMINVQDIWIQETPEELPAGQLPRAFHIRAYGELVDKARPGDLIAVVGIVQPVEIKESSNTFDICMVANSITVLNKEPEAMPDPSELEKIKELAKDPWIHRKIIMSIAPAIYGYEEVKEAIMYLLFGGVPKEREGTKIRGEINVLLVGDPGTAKTQLLKFVQSVAPRGVYCSGRGSTGAGLTAACQRDPDTGEMTLEAGALVLADRGVVCIDEIEKMRPEDRVNIHEPLESQTISVAKGGIVATLNARTAVLAAANPVFGRYNVFKTIFENLASLPATLLSRFDLIFLMLDKPEPERDKKLAEHILNLHRGTVPPPPIPRELLRKYIAYARQINPELTPEAAQLLNDFYTKVRARVEKVETLTEIGARQLEALVRIAEARARAALRDKVLQEDAAAAIKITAQSLKQIGVDVETGEIDAEMLLTGKPKSVRDKMSLILSLILNMEMESGLADKQALLDTLEQEYNIPKHEALRLINQLIREGAIFEPKEGFLKKT
jgi:replicative DNA helicase Mcm